MSRVERAVTKAVESWLDDNLTAIVRKEMGIDLPDGAALKYHQFVCRIQRRLFQYGATREYATTAGARILSDFLRDEKIEYGDPRYAWDGDAALILANEYEMDHREHSA